jgi:hypothetical protein
MIMEMKGCSLDQALGRMVKRLVINETQFDDMLELMETQEAGASLKPNDEKEVKNTQQKMKDRRAKADAFAEEFRQQRREARGLPDEPVSKRAKGEHRTIKIPDHFEDNVSTT